MEYCIETHGISKKYRNFQALDGISMHIPKGSIYGFVGKNGAGKTTLIRILCGMQEPSAGNFLLFGTNNTDKNFTKVKQRIGAVVESPAIYMDITAKQNLMLQYKVLGLPSYDGIDELLHLVGLEEAGSKKVRNFSLGMKQRLGIAISLCGSPDFLILDEPTNGLDPQGIIEMRELILKLNRERQITVLISSHILDELSKLATYYGFIDRGRMLMELSAKELEKECSKSQRVKVSYIKAFCKAKDERNIPNSILSDTQADIFGEISVTELVTALLAEDCTVFSVETRDESLENYYMNLVGGRHYE